MILFGDGVADPVEFLPSADSSGHGDDSIRISGDCLRLTPVS